MTRRKYEAGWYASPLDLPERRVGRVAITHRIIPAGESVPIVGMRQALLRGCEPIMGRLDVPLRIHQLVERQGRSWAHPSVWMTDLPEELNQIKELMFLVKPFGRVLVGGLGLGILAGTVADEPEVTSVRVVERSADVIALCGEPKRYGIVRLDIKEYLRHTRKEYDCILLDTWRGTSEETWWSEVMPLRRIIAQRWGRDPLVHCWAEDIMVGQIMTSLQQSQNWHYKFLNARKPMSYTRANDFVKNVGLPEWEEKYGADVDRAMALKRKSAL